MRFSLWLSLPSPLITLPSLISFFILFSSLLPQPSLCLLPPTFSQHPPHFPLLPLALNLSPPSSSSSLSCPLFSPFPISPPPFFTPTLTPFRNHCWTQWIARVFKMFESVGDIFTRSQFSFPLENLNVGKQKRERAISEEALDHPLTLLLPALPVFTATPSFKRHTQSDDNWAMRNCLFLSVLAEASWGSCYLTVDKSTLFLTKPDLSRLEWSVTSVTGKKVLLVVIFLQVSLFYSLQEPTNTFESSLELHLALAKWRMSCSLWKDFTCWTFKSKTVLSSAFLLQRGFASNILRRRVHYRLIVLL